MYLYTYMFIYIYTSMFSYMSSSMARRYQTTAQPPPLQVYINIYTYISMCMNTMGFPVGGAPRCPKCPPVLAGGPRVLCPPAVFGAVPPAVSFVPALAFIDGYT